MNRAFIERLITEFQNLIIRTGGVERYCENTLFSTLGSKPVKIISGFRRTGKSYLARRIAKKAVESNLFRESDILYLNFEHFELQEYCNAQSLAGIFDWFEEMAPDAGRAHRKLVLLDEIQRVRDWDKYVRTLYEMRGDDVEIILTGSNSELLSAEIGSNLAGRYIEFKLQPFSFREYLDCVGVSARTAHDFRKNRRAIEHHFQLWLRYGGLPEVLSINDESAKYSYLQGVYSKVILDDIVSRFNVRNARVLELIFEYAAVNNGSILQVSKIAGWLQQFDANIKQTTVMQYLEMFCKAFALNEVPRFDWKTGRLFDVRKKYYCVDTGIANCFAGGERNLAKALENAVYLELARRGHKIYYGNDGKKEIDFIAKNNQAEYHKYQVTAALNDSNAAREVGAFHGNGTHLDRWGNTLLYLSMEKNAAADYSDGVNLQNIIEWLAQG